MAVSLSLIILIGLMADWVARRFKLPGLVGMLIAGGICGPYVLNLLKPEMMAVSGDFRSICL
jgi:NhaP-type Na+/H+ or K+/H+ antiporter